MPIKASYTLMNQINFPSSIKEWRERLQSTAPEGGHETYVGRTVRFWSIYSTMLLARTPLTPNMITVISVLVFTAGISLFIFNKQTFNFIGVALIYFSIILDANDGEISRLKGNKSRAGAYVEPISHDIQYGLLFLPITWGLYKSGLGVEIVYVGFAATIFKLWTRFLESRLLGLKEYLGLIEKIAPVDRTQVIRKPWKKRIYFFFNRNMFSSVGMITPFLVFVALDRMDIFVWLFAAGFGSIFALTFVRHVYYVSKLHRHFI